MVTSALVACDPFSKKKATDPKALTHDESPEEYDLRQKKKNAKLRKKLQAVDALTPSFGEEEFPSFPSKSSEKDIHFNERILHEQVKREMEIQKSSYLPSSHGLATQSVSETNQTLLSNLPGILVTRP